jgi:hypothetical protein
LNEHEHGGRRCVSGEHVEHPALVIVREVKESVPDEHTVKPTGKLQRPHVTDQPFMSGEALATERK